MLKRRNVMNFCSLRSSSGGNSEVAFTDKTKILIDCGISGKAALCCLADINIAPNELSAIVVTHEHTDHVRGVGVLCRKLHIPIYASEGTWYAMEHEIGAIPEECIRVFSETDFEIGDIAVHPFKIPHDAAEPCGYAFSADTGSAAVATDMGCIDEGVLDALSGCETVLLEANHDFNMLTMGSYPFPLKNRIKGRLGHLSNDDAAKMAAELARRGTKNILLGHLSRENNYPPLAYNTVKNVLESEGAEVGRDVMLGVAARDRVTAVSRPHTMCSL